MSKKGKKILKAVKTTGRHMPVGTGGTTVGDVEKTAKSTGKKKNKR